MASVPSRRRPTRWPVTSSSSAANEPNLATASRLMRSSAPSPNRASETGASIPAATSDAASPWAGSTRTVSSPAAAACQAIAVPMTPPPATTTSAVTAKSTPFAGITRIRYDGRRRAASLSARGGAPVVGIVSESSPYISWGAAQEGAVIGWPGDE